MTDMRRNSFEDTMAEVVRGYRIAPEPPLDEMWARIERAHFGERGWNSRNRFRSWMTLAIGMAAGLFVGVGIGRYVMPVKMWNAAGSETATAQASSTPESRSASAKQTPTAFAGGAYDVGPYEAVTTEYFGEAAALLRELPTDASEASANARFVSDAGELLATTRLLLDSPAAGDPELRSLLDDLELVLAQIARLRTTRGDIELDLIAGALEQRNVIPRLHSAVAMHSGSNN